MSSLNGRLKRLEQVAAQPFTIPNAQTRLLERLEAVATRLQQPPGEHSSPAEHVAWLLFRGSHE